MVAFASRALSALAGRFAAFRSSSETGLAVCYALGLVASRLIGDGGSGQPLLVIGAPVALGLLLRAGRGLAPIDAVALAAAHVGVASLYGDPPTLWLTTLAHDLVEITCGSLIFLLLRRSGLLTSPLRLALAAVVVAIAGPLAAAPVDIVSMALNASAGWRTVATRELADCVAMVLILGVIMTYGRERGPVQPTLKEPEPRLWEYAASTLLVAAFTAMAIREGGLMPLLAASVALLWFALRLGPFVTALAALGFAAATLGFAGAGRAPVPFAANGPFQAEMLLYLSLALLSAPSIVVAAVVHDQKRLRRIFAYRAMHDGLTTLVNRNSFLEALEMASAAASLSGKRFALLLIDLDHFKAINDTYGHARGDRLLIQVSERLRQSVRTTDVVARIGGDEFAVIAPLSSVLDAMSLAKRLVESVNEACDLNGVTVRPSITVGGALAPDSASAPQQLMLLADEALYEAKRAGRNCWRFSSAAPSDLILSPCRKGEFDIATETVFLD